MRGIQETAESRTKGRARRGRTADGCGENAVFVGDFVEEDLVAGTAGGVRV